MFHVFSPLFLVPFLRIAMTKEMPGHEPTLEFADSWFSPCKLYS